MKNILIFGCLVWTTAATGSTGTITIQDIPQHIVGPGTAASTANLSVRALDFPSGTAYLDKSINLVEYWWYPFKQGTTVRTELCYNPPYLSLEYCLDVTSNQHAVTSYFNTYDFGTGARFRMRHLVSGQESPKSPSDIPDKITITYTDED